MDKLVYTNMNDFVAAPLSPNVYINSTTTEYKAATLTLNGLSPAGVITATIQLCAPIHQHKNRIPKYEVRNHRRRR